MPNIDLDDLAHALDDLRKDFEKKLADLANQAKISVDDFEKAYNNAVDTAVSKLKLETSQVIETKSNADGKVWYKTTIEALGSITNEWPTEEPSSDDLYWKTHKEQVDNALSMRKDVLLKIIETIGSTISGLINPGKSSTS
ncbi:MAG TPA: hypothetical protein VK487_04685 [Candidatus Bathyarchaeia archaeon]|nr:hypothetical protein [Candidatus Bathyarchaeia archaeon]